MKTVYSGVALGMICTAVFASGVPSSLKGEPGLYDVQNYSNMAMMMGHNLRNMSPAAQQKLSDQALHQPGMHFQVCVAQNSSDGLSSMMQMGPDCQFSHEMASAKRYAADVTCHGMTMHLAMAETHADTKEFNLEMQKMPGAAIPMMMKFRIHRVSQSCGGLKPGSVRTPDGKIMDMPKN